MNWKKVSGGLLLFLSCFVLFEAPRIFGTPSPSVNKVVTPGGIGPCSWFISLDGTSIIAEAMIGGLSVSPGDNIVGTDFGTVLRSLAQTGTVFCLAPQTTFTASTFASFGGTNGVVGLSAGSGMVAVGPGTVIKAAASLVLTDNGGIIVNAGGTTSGNIGAFASGFMIDGNRANRAAEKSADLSLNGNGVNDYLVSNMNLTNAPGPGLGLTGTGNIVDNVWLSADSTLATGSPAMYVGNVLNSHFSNIHIINAGWRGIHGYLANDTFSNLRVTGSGDTGIEFSALASISGQSGRVSLTNIWSAFNGGYGIDIKSGGVSDLVSNVQLQNVYTWGNTNGGISLQGCPTNFSISNAQSWNNQQDGLAIGCSGGVGHNVQITNYVGYDNRQQGSGTFNGISVSAVSGVIISNSRLFDDQSTPTQLVGIRVFSNCNNVTIANNDVRSQTGIQIDVGAMNVTARNNLGFNPIGKFGANGRPNPWGIIGTGTTHGIGYGMASTTATPVASTAYTVCTEDVFISVSGGAGLSITVQDVNGNQMFTAAQTTLQGLFLPVGYIINFGGFSASPTFIVFGN